MESLDGGVTVETLPVPDRPEQRGRDPSQGVGTRKAGSGHDRFGPAPLGDDEIAPGPAPVTVRPGPPRSGDAGRSDGRRTDRGRDPDDPGDRRLTRRKS